MSTKIAAAEGAGTGAGGILLGLADFPLLLGIKIKFYSMQQHCTDLIRAIKKSAFYPSRFPTCLFK